MQIGFDNADTDHSELGSEMQLSEDGSDAEDSQAEADSNLAFKTTQATSLPSSKKGKGTGTGAGKQARNKVTTMSDAVKAFLAVSQMPILVFRLASVWAQRVI